MSTLARGYTIANDGYPSKELCRRFSLAEIQTATNIFDDALVIGKGGFGKVYKGVINNGATTVAIKRLHAHSKQGAEEFWTEIKTLSNLQHPHLVTLIGYLSEGEEMALVYEYMVNGTLADHLYKTSTKGNGDDIYHLTWEQRLKICIDAARGLDYLHTEQSVIHRDVKTTNILLDENRKAKISDFGLSRMGTTSQTQTHVSTNVKGTFGYMDPEYFLTRRLTKKSDVYAFGVVLFEVLCARPPVDITAEEEEQCSLALWAQHCIKKGTLDQIVDPSLRGQIPAHGLKVFAEVANRCLHNHPKGRPTMAEVVGSLTLTFDSQGDLPQPKGTITKVCQSIPYVVAKRIDLRLKKWMNRGLKKRLAWRLQGILYVDPSIQLYRQFSLAEIRAATNNFHEQLVVWRSGNTKVYRGHIAHGNLKVAIKRRRIEWTSSQRYLDQFRHELQVVSHLRHLNIVSLIGYCKNKDEVILVYEYMVNGSLYDHLYKTNCQPLQWEKRLEICIGAAQGLQYLHVGTKQKIIHQNLKSTCILLDENWVAQISSLEFSTILPNNGLSTTLNMFVAGNVGYMDPEYLTSTKLTEKSDVYSFGVILLELLCGRKPMIMTQDEDQVNLTRWFKTNINRGTIDQIIDPHQIDKIAPECLKEYVRIAEKCVHDEGIQRPSMDDVLSSLRCALQRQQTWRNVKVHVAVPCSLNNTFSDGTAIADIDSRESTSGLNITSLEDFDYFSGNLAR